MTNTSSSLSVSASPTDDPERQILTVGGIAIGDAVLNANGTAWSWQPHDLGFAVDVDTLRAIVNVLEEIPKPSREAMENYYRDNGYLAEGDRLDPAWGQTDPETSWRDRTAGIPRARRGIIVGTDGVVKLAPTGEVIGSVRQGPKGWSLESHYPLDYSGFHANRVDAACELFQSYLRFITQDEHNRLLITPEENQ